MFALPFVVCSAWAGWLVDRVPKSKLVVWSKFMELAAMLLVQLAVGWVGSPAASFAVWFDVGA